MAEQQDRLTAGWESVRSGRAEEAERLGREVLESAPASAEGWYLLGVACHRLGRRAEAIGHYTQALSLRPDYFDVYDYLGVALQGLGRLGEAAHCYRRALALQPDLPETLINLGVVLRGLGQPGPSAECYRRALALQPDSFEARHNLGNVLRDLGRPDEALECYTQTLRLKPDLPEAHFALGGALRELGRLEEAMAYFRQALELRPDYAEALLNLGIALRQSNRFDEAAACFRQALELRPDLPEAHNSLGIALRYQGRSWDAEGCFRRALELRPRYPEALNNLANTLVDQGQSDEAVQCFRQTLALRPNYTTAHDGLLMTLHYRAGVTPEDLAAEHTDYERRHAAPLRSAWQPHDNDRDSERPLRLGLVSPDFGRHPVGILLIRAVEALARRPGAIVCYSERSAPADDMTVRFQSATADWRNTVGLNDEKLAETIRSDKVDVLIDLAGHTTGNRLLAFARRPAPVQATWLGYDGTTGLEAIGYLVADERVVPPGAEGRYREQVLHLPGGYACYDPPAGAPDPGPPPALASGRVTFGCFNNPVKLSPPALAAFAAVLNRVPGSRLVLQYRGLGEPAAADRLRERLAAVGVRPERVELRGAAAYAEYLGAYREIDIALDPFPFGGGVTTCDALWMGVPVVTLPGPTFASRHGLSYLRSAGLAQLAARDVEGYAALAADLAHDPERLADLRESLRGRVARSPLCNGERLADELLAVLRTAWRVWATGGGQ